MAVTECDLSRQVTQLDNPAPELVFLTTTRTQSVTRTPSPDIREQWSRHIPTSSRAHRLANGCSESAFLLRARLRLLCANHGRKPLLVRPTIS